MSQKIKFCPVVIIFIAFLAVGCGTEPDKLLKPPAVYKAPRVWVTRVSTIAATNLPTTEASLTEHPVVIQPQAGPTLDYEQFLINEIDYLFDKIEGKLDRTNINP